MLTLNCPDYGDVDFGSVFCGPGARNISGKGFWFHPWWKLFGLTWKGVTFVSKSVTLDETIGNMPLRDDGETPVERFPRCIVVEPVTGHMLNAVGLSNKGIEFYMEHGFWVDFVKPFILSFAPTGTTMDARCASLRKFVALFKPYLERLLFRAPMALQINFSCPNAAAHVDMFAVEAAIEEIKRSLDIAAELDVPLIPNFNPVVPADILMEVSKHPQCDALWIANTIPWGTPGIDWKGLFGSETSPLIARGFKQPGGLSGPLCLPFTIDKVSEARELGVWKPIVAGNGIRTAEDVETLKDAGANAIAIASVAVVSPLAMRSIIRTGDRVFK